MSHYDPQTPEEIAARLADCKAKLKARQGIKIFAENVKVIEAEITRLEALASAY